MAGNVEQGLKPGFFPNGSARLKPCPDTKLLEAGDRPIDNRPQVDNLPHGETGGNRGRKPGETGNRGQTGRSPDSPVIFRSFSALFIYHGPICTRGGD